MTNDDANGSSPPPGTPNQGAVPPPPPAGPGAAADPSAPQPPSFGPPTSQPPAYDQQPAPAYGTPSPAAYGAPPPGYAPGVDAGMVKGPRPDVKVGGILVVAGALATIIAVFLPWTTGSGASLNGMDDFLFFDDGDLYLAESPGTVPMVFGVIMLGLGLALVFAGRVLAVAIIAIVGAVIAALIGLVMAGIASGQADDISGADIGIGAIIQPIAPLISLAGAIVATSKRRRMVPASSMAPTPGAVPQPPPFG